MLGWIIAVFFILFSLVLTIFINVQLKKIAKYEKWVIRVINKVDNVYSTMQSLDRREMFSKDDDVGILFEKMKETIYSLEDINE